MKVVTAIMTENLSTDNLVELMRKVILFLTLAVTAAFFTTGCLRSETTEPSSALADSASQQQRIAFQANQDRWKAAKPPSYSFQLSRNCFCFPYGRMEVFVDGDKVVKVDTIPGVEGPYDLESLRNAPSMDGIFGEVEGYLNNPEYEVKASYDAKMGYLTSVSIHHTLNYEDADAEFQIASFRPQQ